MIATAASTGALATGAAQDLDPELGSAFARADAALGAIVAVPAGERSFENTVGAIDDAVARLFMEVRWTGFLSNVHPELDVRARGEVAEVALSRWFSELHLNEPLFRAVEEYAAGAPALEGERARFLEHSLRDFRRAGMALAPEQRERLKAIERELVDLGQEFGNHIRDDESVVALTAEELEGCPPSFVAGLPRSGELYVLEMKGPVIRPFFNNCARESSRHKVSLVYGRRGGLKNVGVLEKMIRLRQEKALLLGYAHTADYETEVKMAQDAASVLGFYEELRPKLRRKALLDHEEYTQAKRRLTGDPDAVLQAWDNSFVRNWLLANEYAVDQEVVREYFPLERVYAGLFDVTQRLFGIEYRDVTGEAAERGRPVWHPDVRLYEVRDGESGALLGEFYTDLFPRPNKYSHAAQFPLVLRKRWPDGSLTTPVVALVCNFTKPEADKPSLLMHSEVETFFHEFGHCLHSILSEAQIASFSGTNVARDFVEAPSQMLENWVWDAGVLRTFAGHYQTGEPLPEALLEGMLRARNLGSGSDAEYQVFLGMMDMRYHSDPDGVVDTTELAFETQRECRLVAPIEGTYIQAAFGHLDGYQAGYYGYLWSLVYAQDMFTWFREHGLLDPAAGKRYREAVLAKGGTVDAIELVRAFLGREPNSDAFLEHLGLDDGE